MIEIVPAVLVGTLDELKAKLVRLKDLTRRVQIDVCDGYFTPTRTWPYPGGEVQLPYAADFDFEVDLMVQRPEKVLAEWVRAGIMRAVFHLESPHDFRALTQSAGDIELGLGIDLDPPHERIAAYVERVEYFQVMGIGRLGKQGEPFDARTIPLIERLKTDFPQMPIQVDGGVDPDTASALVAAGASRLVVGHYIVNADDPKVALEMLQSGIQ